MAKTNSAHQTGRTKSASPRKELAEKICDFIVEHDLAQVFGGDIGRDFTHKSKPYTVCYSKRAVLDGVVTIYGNSFIQVKEAGPQAKVPESGAVFKSEADFWDHMKQHSEN